MPIRNVLMPDLITKQPRQIRAATEIAAERFCNTCFAMMRFVPAICFNVSMKPFSNS